ncbi:hypothetical protein HPB48_017044 [Haemaphysalis longicornis]|uniref:C2H2-type domain-containing protein n=1 Tax=Haemaphysalis longicornis TaxID=44386 RepID=A0A9J6FJX2_HAELO|nr:hypothetical protein HPB48_017044 [Haemaphysalis longicornis]
MKYRCPHPGCTYKSRKRGNSDRHYGSLHTAFVGKSAELLCCGTTYPTKYELEAHRKKVHAEGYGCSECQKIIPKPSLLERHKQKNTGERPFPCGKCDYRAGSRSNLKRHQKTHSHFIPPSRGEEKENEEGVSPPGDNTGGRTQPDESMKAALSPIERPQHYDQRAQVWRAAQILVQYSLNCHAKKIAREF